jgi:hypothetical protein
MEELREFIAESEELAKAKAAEHFGVGPEKLETRLLPDSLEISGLGGRVVLLAAPLRVPQEVGPVGEFMRGVVERMQLGGKLSVDERDDDGRLRITLDCDALAERARDEVGLGGALSHLAERAAEKFLEEGTRVRVDIGRAGRDERRGGGRGDRDRGRGGDRDRGRGGDRDRGRGGDRDRARGGDRERARGEPGRGPRASEDRDREQRSSRGPEDDNLEQLAQETGERVQETGEVAYLDDLNSRERWVVHNALKDVEGITSESVGDGRLKRVKIVPD